MLAVVIRNSALNKNKFNFLDSTANYSANFQDRKVIFSPMDIENISLLKNEKNSIFLFKNHIVIDAIRDTPKVYVVIRNTDCTWEFI